MFLSTPPSRVATDARLAVGVGGNVSIHATLAGGDSNRHACPPSYHSFYPRHPRGWRPSPAPKQHPGKEFLSTPPSRVATVLVLLVQRVLVVSIHATLAGGDDFLDMQRMRAEMFLSTPPSRVATSQFLGGLLANLRFYPRHPRGWRLDSTGNILCGHVDVSIHATLAGGDRSSLARTATLIPFLSTPPSRVATVLFWYTPLSLGCFYPRHPRGWRRQKCTKMYSVFCAKGKNYL